MGFAWEEGTNTCVMIHLGVMTQIPAGCFGMGDPFSEGYVVERPVHNVCISGFEMDIHEVTNVEYADCVGFGGCSPPRYSFSDSRATYYGDPAYEDFAVIYVDWLQAREYCTWVGKRLPTEAEWEYAARGGLAGKRYPWGDTISGSDANYLDSGDTWDNDTSPVEHYAANGYGLYDMAGNVNEWVNDWYQSGYYNVSPVNDPPGPPTGQERVHRGGSWTETTFFLRVAYRGKGSPDFESGSLGFRCARGGAYGP
jgi:formylglycine-generating enzyme required for sulfatase activity